MPVSRPPRSGRPPARWVAQDDAQGSGRQMRAVQRYVNALAELHTLQVHPGPAVPNLRGTGTAVGHDPVRHMGKPALPLLPHLPVQEWIIVPLVQLQQDALQAFTWPTVVGHNDPQAARRIDVSVQVPKKPSTRPTCSVLRRAIPLSRLATTGSGHGNKDRQACSAEFQ